MLFDKIFPWPVFKTRTDSNSGSRELWRSLYLLNIYRLLLGSLLFSMVWIFGSDLMLGERNLPLFYRVNIAEVKDMQQKAASKKWPAAAAEMFKKGSEKLERMHPSTPDYSVVYNHLDLMLDLPWQDHPVFCRTG